MTKKSICWYRERLIEKSKEIAVLVNEMSSAYPETADTQGRNYFSLCVIGESLMFNLDPSSKCYEKFDYYNNGRK